MIRPKCRIERRRKMAVTRIPPMFDFRLYKSVERGVKIPGEQIAFPHPVEVWRKDRRGVGI